MKEVSICFNFCEPKDYDSYCQRCALFSGTGKKYSISYITAREEGKAQKIKEIYEKLNVTNLPTSLDQIIEAKAQDKSDDEKKEIYDTSFQFIKDERFTFRLPRGTKREPKKAAQQNDSAGGGAWGGGGGAQNQSNQGWGGGAQTQQNQGWGGGAPNQPANDAWGGGGGVVQENQTQDAWGAQNDQPQDGFGGQQQSKPVQDGWGSQPQEQNAEQQWGEQPTKKVHFEQPQEQQSGW